MLAHDCHKSRLPTIHSKLSQRGTYMPGFRTLLRILMTSCFVEEYAMFVGIFHHLGVTNKFIYSQFRVMYQLAVQLIFYDFKIFLAWELWLRSSHSDEIHWRECIYSDIGWDNGDDMRTYDRYKN